jgi:hypothetical protein
MTSSIYQLEGFDNEGRYFARPVTISASGSLFSVSFSYEGLDISAKPNPSQDEALKELAYDLKKRGFKKIRAKLNYLGDRYLAERKPWVYLD